MIQTKLHSVGRLCNLSYFELASPKTKKVCTTSHRISREQTSLAQPRKKMAKPILTSTITIRRQYPSRSLFLFPWSQSLKCLHTTTVRPRSAHQSITTRQPAQASPMLLAKQQYLKTRIKDLGILPGMYPPERPQPSSYMYISTENERARPRMRTIPLRLLYIYYRNFHYAYW